MTARATPAGALLAPIHVLTVKQRHFLLVVHRHGPACRARRLGWTSGHVIAGAETTGRALVSRGLLATRNSRSGLAVHITTNGRWYAETVAALEGHLHG